MGSLDVVSVFTEDVIEGIKKIDFKNLLLLATQSPVSYLIMFFIN